MDSLRKRFTVRFATQIVSGLILLVTQSLMLRGLGPKLYGDYNFTTQFFSQVTAFLDFGVTTAFFTKLSQRPDDNGLIRFYYGFWAVLTLVQIALVSLVFTFPFADFLWPGQTFSVVVFGMMWGILSSVWQGTSRIADAYALTVRSEKYKVVMRAASLLLILPFFLVKQLTLPIVFISQILSFALLAVVLYRMARPAPGILLGRAAFARPMGAYLSEMRDFCLPLLVYSGASVVSGLFDSWILQKFGGSVQQGFLGLSSQLGLVCLLFCSAMLPLVHREFSVAHARNEGEKEIYLKCIPPVVGASAFIAVYIAVNSQEIVRLFSGPDYSAATLVVAIGVLYTIPQCFSQMTGSLFYASSRTALFRNLGLLSVFLGVPISFALVGPGLRFGALGLAVKMLTVALVIMVVQVFLTSKQLGLSFASEMARYGRMLSILGLGAYLSFAVSRSLFSSDLFRLFFSLLWFAGFGAIVALLVPSGLGLSQPLIRKFRFHLRATR